MPRPDDNALGPFHHIAPETSLEAAIANYPKSGTQRAALLLAIGHNHGFTDQEAGVILDLSGDSIRPRRNELLGRTHPPSIPLIRDSGRRRPTPSGANAVVWVVTEEGWAAITALRGPRPAGYPPEAEQIALPF